MLFVALLIRRHSLISIKTAFDIQWAARIDLILTINNKSINDLTPILYVIFKAIEY
jgi:hypothetical protein